MTSCLVRSSRTTRACLALAALFGLTWFAATADASHFRSAVITWTREPGTRNVTFTVTAAYRTDYSDNTLQVNFGNGASYIFAGPTVGSGPGYIVRQESRTVTYSGDGPWTVTYNSSARLNNLVNAGGQSYRATTIVDLRNNNNGSPVTTSPPIIQMIRGGVNNIPLAIADPQGHAFTCRLATANESGIPTQPSAGGKTISVSPAGVLSWDTSSTQIGQLYAVAVVVEETGNDTQIMTDFLIEIVDGTLNKPPVITSALPNGSTHTVPAGTPFSATFDVSDPDNDNLLISNLGLPPGASQVPGSGSTVPSGTDVVFSWTPQPIHRGQVRTFNLNARDPGNLDTNYAINIRVPDNQRPDVECPEPVAVEQDGPTTNVMLSAEVGDADGDALTVKWKEGAATLKTQSVTGPDALAGAIVTLSHAFGPGSHVITLEVSDGLEVHSCDTTILIQDTTDPTFVVTVEDVEVPTDPGVDYATNVDLGQPTVIDNSGASPTLTNDAPSQFPLGDTIVTWTAVDAAQNESQIVQTVTVVDEEDPMFVTFPADVVTDVDFGEPFATVVLETPTAIDNADATLSITNDAPLVFPPGTNQVVWTVEDDAGNQITGIQLVTVVAHDPVADAGADVTVPWTSAAGAVVQLDGSGSFDEDGHDLEFHWEATGITFDDPESPTPSALFPVGTTVVTLHLHDESGGHSHDTVSVTVVPQYVVDTRDVEAIDDCLASMLLHCQALKAANPSSPYATYALKYAELAVAANAEAKLVTYFDENDLPGQKLLYKAKRYQQYKYSLYVAQYAHYVPGGADAKAAATCAGQGGLLDYNTP